MFTVFMGCEPNVDAIVDEVETLASARSSALKGSEPGDAIRVR
jgi:hypothetical protein